MYGDGLPPFRPGHPEFDPAEGPGRKPPILPHVLRLQFINVGVLGRFRLRWRGAVVSTV